MSGKNKFYMLSRAKTKAMQRFLEKEADRVVDFYHEGDSVFIHTNSDEWADENGSGTFVAESETAAIKKFYDRVRRVQ